MTRYFYPASRTHHAYAMAIDFGMRFKKRNGYWSPEGLLTVTGAGGYRIEIAEESLHLLEPQTGDVLSWVTDKGYSWQQDHYAEVFPTGEALQTAHRIVETAKLCARIIQRNGIPFHWPEIEP